MSLTNTRSTYSSSRNTYPSQVRSDRNLWRNYDYSLLIVSFGLVVFGVMMIASATNGAVATELISRVPNQIQYALYGTVLMFMLTLMDYRLLGSLSFWLYIALIILLVMVLLFGQEGDGGARRWINLGILIQPSEIGKIIIIITLGQFLSTRYQKMNSLRPVIASGLHLGVPVLLIFLQPDLGTTIVFVVLWFTLIWAAGLRFKHIMMFIMAGILLFPIFWNLMEPYQRERFTTFIAVSQNTGEDDLETRTGTEYNYRQAAISIGSGGLLGKGYMNGTQSQLRFLRVRHTDFIFSVIAEEFGFVGGIV